MTSLLFGLLIISSIAFNFNLSLEPTRIMTRTLRVNAQEILKASINTLLGKLDFSEPYYKDIAILNSSYETLLDIKKIQNNGQSLIDLSRSFLKDFDSNCLTVYNLNSAFSINFRSSAQIPGQGMVDLYFSFQVSDLTISRHISPNNPTNYYLAIIFGSSLESIKCSEEEITQIVNSNKDAILNSISPSVQSVLDASFSALTNNANEIQIEVTGLPNETSSKRKIIAQINEKIDCSSEHIVTNYRASILESYKIKSTSKFTFDEKHGDNQVFYDSSLLDELIQSKLIDGQFQFLIFQENAFKYTDLSFKISELRAIIPEIFREANPNETYHFDCTANDGTFQLVEGVPSIRFKLGCSINTDSTSIFKFNLTYLLHLYAPLDNFKKLSVKIPIISLIDTDIDVNYNFKVNNDLLFKQADTIMKNYISQNPVDFFSLNISVRDYSFVPNAGLLFQYPYRFSQENLLLLS